MFQPIVSKCFVYFSPGCKKDGTQRKWCYLFRNLSKFARIPNDASDFETIFEIALTEQFEEEQLKIYLNAMVTDYEKLVIGEYHEQKGFKEGSATVDP